METNAQLIVGGSSDGFPEEQWPHYHGMPLAYLARYVLASGTYYIFLDGPNNEVDQSWQPEDGSNAVLWVSEGVVSDLWWITPSRIEKPLERLTEAYRVDIPDAPDWLQGDEDQDGYMFAGQIDSDLDHILNIGDAHGMAYLFVNDENKEARLIWQS